MVSSEVNYILIQIANLNTYIDGLNKKMIIIERNFLSENSQLIKGLLANVNKLMEKVFEPCFKNECKTNLELLQENFLLRHKLDNYAGSLQSKDKIIDDLERKIFELRTQSIPASCL